MKEINFITIGDKNFFSLIHFSIKQVLKFYPTAKLYIYDWGFTPSQKKKIGTYPNTILIDWTDKLKIEDGYKAIRKIYDGYIPLSDAARRREYLLNQKPVCILDCSKRIKENLIFYDGDAMIINHIDEIFEDNYDIGLTVNTKFVFEHKNISRGPFSWKRGVNSGIIFFKLKSIPMQVFTQEWINEIKTHYKRVLWEQTSLFNLIRKRNSELLYQDYNIGIIKLANLKYRIKIFPTDIYNFVCNGRRYNDKKVKFLHFITMRRYIPERSKRSMIIRDLIREIKLRHAFYHISKLFSPILLPKFKKNIREIFSPFLIFKLFVRPLNILLFMYVVYTVLGKIRKKMTKQEI
ncbi:MAG: hypothetical protein ACFFAT_22215 [Promethearchaeota archaeon]